MEEAEPPECPICLQSYDVVSAVPRVLTCGHTTCEACLKQLPSPFPNTLRCTVCTLLVKIPNSLSSLPKNLDLLHFSSLLQQRRPLKDNNVNSPSSPPENVKIQSILFPSNGKSWSYEFYREWKKWIIPKDCISIEKLCSEKDGGVVNGKIVKSFESDQMLGFIYRERENVGLINVGNFLENKEDSEFFKSSYESRITTVLYGMKEEKRDELRIILNATVRASNVGKAYGFWYNEDNNYVYMIWQKITSPNLMNFVLNKKDDEVEIMSRDELTGLAMLGTETCEIMSRLHLEGIIVGCLGMSCFYFDDFGRVCIDLSEVINAGKRVSTTLQRATGNSEVDFKSDLLIENLVFISPEMLLQFLAKEGFEFEFEKSRYEVGHVSDVWSIASLLISLIVGSSFGKEMESLLNFIVNSRIKGCDFPGSCMSWKEKIAKLLEYRLGSECETVLNILCKCLEFDPGNRPTLTQLWKCLRELNVKSKFDIGLSLRNESKKENPGKCIVIGEMCHIIEEFRADGDVVEGMLGRHVKCIEMKGHLDCVTGLTVGGGFLFSSSYDKIVRVWSLQDLTHVHSFRGHEHRVTAVVFLDGEQPSCISGDNEGVICIWKADFPLSEVPIKKLYEKKDWRYSGIHAMAIFGTEYLYTGSGDKLVKAWSLQDYTMSCEMSGHTSVVSTLIVYGGVLYSGSWDGTVRLWSLSDHSALTVLGEGKIGNVASVLSLYADGNLLFVGCENGSIKIWHNNVLVKSRPTHEGAIFSVGKKGKWLFSGGLDKTVSLQEISEHVDGVDVTPVGCIPCNSTVTALMYSNGKLFVGQADRIIKVYHGF